MFISIPFSVRIWAIQQVAFHVSALAFEYCDRSGAFWALKKRHVDRDTYANQMARVLQNQCMMLLPCMLLTEILGICYRGSTRITLTQVLLTLPAMAIGHDLVQYTTHRYILHLPNLVLMRLLRHSVHHSTGATSGISACYMTMPDFFLEIVLPYLIPLSLIGGGGRNFIFHALIVSLGAFGGVYEHSGYDFADIFPESKSAQDEAWPISQILKTLLSNRSHSEHHIRSKVSFADGFGSPGICDTLFRTRWDLVPNRHTEAEKEWQSQNAQLAESAKGQTCQ